MKVWSQLVALSSSGQESWELNPSCPCLQGRQPGPRGSQIHPDGTVIWKSIKVQRGSFASLACC